VGPRLLTVAVDGGALYVGGSFSGAGGQARANAAKLDATTGAVQSWSPPGSWNADPYSGVHEFETSQGAVLQGGGVPFVNGLLALDESSGGSIGWAPTINGRVDAISRWHEYVLVGGAFAAVGSAHAGGFAAILDPSVLGVVPPGVGVRASLGVPWPNPSRNLGRVAMTLPHAALVEMRLLDVAGRLVKLVQPSRSFDAGRHVFEIPTAGLAPGLYVVVARAGAEQLATKLIVTR
jgi:hypothetical protein